MNVLSLFDGMSCGQIALNRAGISYDNYFASEIDKHAIKVTQHNYPNTIQLGDVTKVSASQLPKIDLLIGGSPCQSFSFSGKMKGMVTNSNIPVLSLNTYIELKESGVEFDGQSYLFWEYVRLLNEVKPKYFLLENVMMQDKWKKIITDTLGVEPVMINSALVSAQNRKRLYWTNIPNVTQPEDLGITIKDILTLNVNDYSLFIENRKINGKNAMNKLRLSERGVNDKFRCLTAGGQGGTNAGATTIRLPDGKLRIPTPEECEMAQTVDVGYTNCVSKTQRYRMLGNGWTVDVIVHLLKGLKDDISI
jgi:DNA-cytosine methyltransferase